MSVAEVVRQFPAEEVLRRIPAEELEACLRKRRGDNGDQPKDAAL